MWYPQNKQELESFIEKSFNQKAFKINKKIHGLIVPHAGYEYSGMIAGKAFSLLKNKEIKKAIILGPSHHIPTNQILTTNKKFLETPLGKVKLFNIGFQISDISQEHSLNNQIPFLQKLEIKKILPLMIGNITNEQALEIAKKIVKQDSLFIFSTDLSHFHSYENANKIDKSTIKIIENLEFENFKNIDACGYYPLLVLFHLCKILNTKPHLIEYKNSGDVTNDKLHEVVGYASFWF